LDTKDLAYLATCYTVWKDDAGIHNAYVDAAKITGALMKQGYKVYSPIVHGHPVSLYANVDPLDHSFWLDYDRTMLTKCDVLLVAKMKDWEKSKGIAFEIEFFKKVGKPIFYLDPETLEISQ
jgi:hypothetical protein